MDHTLHCHYRIGIGPQGQALQSRMMELVVETNLGPSPQLKYPDLISCKIVGATPAFMARPAGDLQLGFEGKRYRLSNALKEDGSFELRKDW